MNKALPWLRALFIFIMLCCVGILIWYSVMSGVQANQLDEARRDLKAAKGNIRAHQSGFSTALDDIMNYQDELDRMIPESIEGRMLLDQYNAEIRDLKQRRDQLNDELKKKAPAVSTPVVQEESHD